MLKILPPDFQFCPFCGKKLGLKKEEQKERKYCPSCNWTYYPHVGASAGAIILRRGKILLVQRKRPPYKDTWMLPAGFVDFGEHPEQTVSREVKEETGLKVKKLKLIKVVQSEDDPRSPGHFMFFYRVWAVGSQLKTDEEENSSIAWFDLQKLPQIGWKAHKKLISEIKKSYLKR